MADKKQPIIIKKKKGGGGHGHHGGAWKVAYADFVTAMMAFFLVMWLMGSDEETKSAISHYFNHPNTPYHDGKDPNSDVVNPLGEYAGEGESLLNGMNGQNPDDMTPNPVRPESYASKYEQVGELVSRLLDDDAFGIEIEVDHLKFSVLDETLFVPGTSKFKDGAREVLDRVGRILKVSKGFITIESHTHELELNGHPMSSTYEASVVKAVAVMDHLVKGRWLPEDKMKPVGAGDKEPLTHSSSPEKSRRNQRIEFIVSESKKY
jgi:chemotaxis protein MotB